MEKAELLHIVAHNMKKYRAAHSLSQEKFSELAGISLSFCAAVESERKIPSTYTLRNMADKLGVTTDYFLYPDSAALEIKTISAQLAQCSADYLSFISRLVSLCNEYYGEQK